jgi:hypothetical protein
MLWSTALALTRWRCCHAASHTLKHRPPHWPNEMSKQYWPEVRSCLVRPLSPVEGRGAAIKRCQVWCTCHVKSSRQGWNDGKDNSERRGTQGRSTHHCGCVAILVDILGGKGRTARQNQRQYQHDVGRHRVPGACHTGGASYVGSQRVCIGRGFGRSRASVARCKVVVHWGGPVGYTQHFLFA